MHFPFDIRVDRYSYNRQALYEKGITMNDVNPDYVVVGETRTYSFEKIEKAVNQISQGIAGNIKNAFTDLCLQSTNKNAVPIIKCI